MALKNIIILSVLTLIFSFNLLSQEFSNEFGKITNYEINMTEYDKEKTAEAVVIYNIGKSTFDNSRVESGFEISFIRSTKIKILKESAQHFAEIEIPYYIEDNTHEKINTIEAYTYNLEDGKLIKTKLDPKNIFTEKKSENWYVKKFALPNVKKGSVIEYKYQLITPFLLHLPDWEFQSTVPTIYSEYTVNTIPFYEYQWRLQGANRFDIQETYKDESLFIIYKDFELDVLINRFVMKDVPAFSDELFITSVNDYIIKIDFQLAIINQTSGGTIKILTTWEKLTNGLIKNSEFGNFVKSSANKYKSTVKDKGLLSKTEDERFEYIINEIKSNYNKNEFDRYLANKSVNAFLKQKTGSCAEINLFFTGALNAAEIEAYPVILSTRKHGKIIKQYPFENAFNYTIVYAKINDKWGLYDATDSYCPNNRIPEKCINDIGLLIKKDETKWIKLVPNEISIIQRDFHLNLSSNLDTVIGKIKMMTTAYEAMNYRKKYKNKLEDIEKDIITGDLNLVKGPETENYEDLRKQYIIKYEISSFSERIGNKIIIHPFLNIPINDNPLKQETRQYPVDITYPKSRFYLTEFEIPETCEIEKIPENFSYTTNLFFLQYEVKQVDNKLIVKAMYQFKRSVYAPEDYSKMKRYFNLIIKHLNQKIVLVKE